MSTPFVHNSVYQPIIPSSSSWFRIVVNCSSRFHFRSRYYYYYSLGLSGSHSDFLITIYYYYLLIYLTKFVVYVDQMGYVVCA
jgi:hypothetical protein